MGQLKDVSSIKLSDFIDEKFLEEIDDVDEVVHETRAKQPLQHLLESLLGSSTTELLHAPNVNKRAKTEDGSVHPTALLCSPLLSFIIHLTENIVHLDWRKRQAAASQLRALICYACTEASKNSVKLADLEYYSISTKDNGFMTIAGTNAISFSALIKNMLPRLLLFIIKDNFSDFEGLKVLAPAREEGIQLLAEIQY